MKHGFLRRIFLFMTVFMITVFSFPLCETEIYAANILNRGDYTYRILDDGKSAAIVRYKGNGLYEKLPSKVDKYYVTKVDSAAFM